LLGQSKGRPLLSHRHERPYGVSFESNDIRKALTAQFLWQAYS